MFIPLLSIIIIYSYDYLITTGWMNQIVLGMSLALG